MSIYIYTHKFTQSVRTSICLGRRDNNDDRMIILVVATQWANVDFEISLKLKHTHTECGVILLSLLKENQRKTIIINMRTPGLGLLLDDRAPPCIYVDHPK